MDESPALIYLHRVDLEVAHDRNFEIDRRGSGVTSRISIARLFPIAPLQHWTLEVRGTCYEVTEQEPGLWVRDKPGHDLYILPTEDWNARREAKKLKLKTMIVGATRKSDDYIKQQGK